MSTLDDDVGFLIRRVIGDDRQLDASHPEHASNSLSGRLDSTEHITQTQWKAIDANRQAIHDLSTSLESQITKAIISHQAASIRSFLITNWRWLLALGLTALISTQFSLILP